MLQRIRKNRSDCLRASLSAESALACMPVPLRRRAACCAKSPIHPCQRPNRFATLILIEPLKTFAVSLIVAIASCGGESLAPALPDAAQLSAQQSAAPRFTGDVALDGLHWINFRRQQAGLSPLSREPALDEAATAHARYQQRNNLVTHDQDHKLSGFSGEQAPDRLLAAGYPLRQQAVAEGEIVGASMQADGFAIADELLTAIYHRYVILEPVFDQAGAGMASRAGGYTWLTVNFVASRGDRVRPELPLVVWPAIGQTAVRTYFFSDQETPDPVPGQDRVGYPVSVHAPMFSRLRVDRFTISEPKGEPLPVRLLDPAQDTETPNSAAAIVPIQPLLPGRVYEVRFAGTINTEPIGLQWSFTTQ